MTCEHGIALGLMLLSTPPDSRHDPLLLHYCSCAGLGREVIDLLLMGIFPTWTIGTGEVIGGSPTSMECNVVMQIDSLIALAVRQEEVTGKPSSTARTG